MHKFDEFKAADKSHDLSLNKVADAVRKGKIVFQTLGEPILHKFPEISDNSALHVKIDSFWHGYHYSYQCCSCLCVCGTPYGD